MNPTTVRFLPFLFLSLTSLLAFSQFEADENVNVSQKVEGDYYAAGSTVSINAPINGDLVTAGGKIYVNDSIAEDLIVAGGEIMVSAPVIDDIRCAGGTISINDMVGDDVIVFGGEVRIGNKVPIKGNLIVFGGNVTVDGDIAGNVALYAGEVDLNGSIGGALKATLGEITLRGTVSGPATIAAENLRFRDGAYIDGDLNYWTEDGEIDIDPSFVAGSIRYDEDLMPTDDNWKTMGLFAGGLFFLLLGVSLIFSGLIVILILKYLFGHHLNLSAEVLKEQVGASVGYGLMYIIGVPVVVILLFVVVIGIPVGFLLLSIYGFSLIFGQAVFSLILIYYLNQQREAPWNAPMIILLAWLVLILLRFVGFIPFIGWLISLLTMAAGYGAIILMLIKESSARRLGALEEGN